MTADLAERKNLQVEHPEVVARLTRLLEQYVSRGRSTPGLPHKNDAQIDIWKKEKAARQKSS
jgi:arylsulfatase A